MPTKPSKPAAPTARQRGCAAGWKYGEDANPYTDADDVDDRAAWLEGWRETQRTKEIIAERRAARMGEDG